RRLRPAHAEDRLRSGEGEAALGAWAGARLPGAEPARGAALAGAGRRSSRLAQRRRAVVLLVGQRRRAHADRARPAARGAALVPGPPRLALEQALAAEYGGGLGARGRRPRSGRGCAADRRRPGRQPARRGHRHGGGAVSPPPEPTFDELKPRAEAW